MILRTGMTSFIYFKDKNLFFLSFQQGNGTASSVVLEESEEEETAESPKTNHKHFFRRLSFKGLRKGKVNKLNS